MNEALFSVLIVCMYIFTMIMIILDFVLCSNIRNGFWFLRVHIERTMEVLNLMAAFENVFRRFTMF